MPVYNCKVSRIAESAYHITTTANNVVLPFVQNNQSQALKKTTITHKRFKFFKQFKFLQEHKYSHKLPKRGKDVTIHPYNHPPAYILWTGNKYICGLTESKCRNMEARRMYYSNIPEPVYGNVSIYKGKRVVVSSIDTCMTV